jgi:hypothetical protein
VGTADALAAMNTCRVALVLAGAIVRNERASDLY